MTDDASRPGLSPGQIILLYERQLNRTVLMHLVGGLLSVVLAVSVVLLIKPLWLGIVVGIVLILAGGMLQRLLVLRVRCPACGARVLGRIHSIVQARGMKTCPVCDVTLRS